VTAECAPATLGSSATILYGKITIDEPTLLTGLGARGDGSGSGPVRLALFKGTDTTIGEQIACASPTTPSAVTGIAAASISSVGVDAGTYWVSVSVTASSDFQVWSVKDTSSRYFTKGLSSPLATCKDLGACPEAGDTVVSSYNLAVWAKSTLSGQECIHLD